MAAAILPNYDDEQLHEQLHRWAERMSAVKVKIGESWGTRPERDLDRVAEARSIVGENTALYVDANGLYSAGQAIRVGKLLEQLDVRWFEEPVSSDDLAGLRRVRDATTADVAASEYGQARVELLVRMFGEELTRAFAEIKGVFDPANRMNPGKVVAPYRVDENLRLGSDYRPESTPTCLGYPDDEGSFHQGVMRGVRDRQL